MTRTATPVACAPALVLDPKIQGADHHVHRHRRSRPEPRRGHRAALRARRYARRPDLPSPRQARTARRGAHRGGITADFESADIRESSALSSAIGALADRLGPVEVLEHSQVPAREFMQPVLETTVDDLRANLEFSVLGPVAAVTAVIDPMLERASGTLLFTTGGAAINPQSAPRRRRGLVRRRGGLRPDAPRGPPRQRRPRRAHRGRRQHRAGRRPPPRRGGRRSLGPPRRPRRLPDPARPRIGDARRSLSSRLASRSSSDRRNAPMNVPRSPSSSAAGFGARPTSNIASARVRAPACARPPARRDRELESRDRRSNMVDSVRSEPGAHNRPESAPPRQAPFLARLKELDPGCPIGPRIGTTLFLRTTQLAGA